VRNEAKRQSDLLKLRDELIRRKSHRAFSSQDVTDVFKATKNNLLRKIVLEGGRIIAILLPEFGGLLKWECGDRTLGKELAGYAAAYGLGGMIHTDEDIPKYDIVDEMELVKKRFADHENQPVRKSHSETQDAIALVAWKAPAVSQAAEAIMERAKQCSLGVPEETRVADGLGTKHARPLPGKARMYPETDIPPIPITQEFLDSIELPMTLEEKGKAIEKMLPKQMAEQLIHSPYLSLFETLSKEHDPMLVASTLLYALIDIRRRGFGVDKLEEADFRALFDLVKRGKIPKDVLADALIMRIGGKGISEIDSAFSEMPEPELRAVVKGVVKRNPGQAEGALMGMIMKEARGRASGARAARILREEMK
jgi:glutamyl-tRNA(Gln) amidotransferase subunit E